VDAAPAADVVTFNVGGPNGIASPPFPKKPHHQPTPPTPFGMIEARGTSVSSVQGLKDTFSLSFRHYTRCLFELATVHFVSRDALG